MARRDRYRDRVWLRKLPGDPADGNLTQQPDRYAPMSDIISQLTGEYRLWLEVEKDAATYYVRCYPMTPADHAITPQICASYSGLHLLAVLATALNDYVTYADKPTAAQLSRQEHVRCVM